MPRRPAPRCGDPACQFVVDGKYRRRLELFLGHRDKRFLVRGLEPPGQFGRVFWRMADRNAHFNRTVAVSGDHAMKDDETFARYAAAPQSMRC